MEFEIKKNKVSKKKILEEFEKKLLEKQKKKVVSIDDIIKKHMVKKKPSVKKVKRDNLKDIVNPYKSIPLSESSYFVFIKQLDYNRLYSYLGKLKTSTVSTTDIYTPPEEIEQTFKSSNNTFTYHEISSYLRKFTINNLIGTEANSISVKERERMNNYTLCNPQERILASICLGVPILQTDIPAMQRGYSSGK